MMKFNRFLGISLLLTMTLSCVSSNEQEMESSTEELSEFDCYGEFQILYKELQSFKSNEDFHSLGFGRGGEYFKWLTSVEKATNEDCKVLLTQYGFVFGELEALGLEYLKTKGEENDYTRFLNNQFSPKESEPEPKKEQNVSNEVIGKWKLYNSYAPDESIEMHILLEEGFYYEYFPNNDSRKKLSKQGNRFSIVGDKNGEYYVLSSNGKLEMFDNEGNLDEVGWSAKKLSN